MWGGALSEDGGVCCGGRGSRVGWRRRRGGAKGGFGEDPLAEAPGSRFPWPSGARGASGRVRRERACGAIGFPGWERGPVWIIGGSEGQGLGHRSKVGGMGFSY